MRPTTLISVVGRVTVMSVVGRIVAPRLVRRLGPVWLLFGMSLGWLWQIIDWSGLIAAATALPPSGSALAGLLIAGGLPLSSRAALTPVFHTPGIAFLDRQPITPTSWSLALLPWALAASVPVGLVAVLWAVPWRGAWMLLWALAASATTVAAAAPGWRGLAMGLTSSLAGAALIGLARALPSATPAVAALALGGCVWSLGRLHRAGRRPTGDGAGRLPGRARSPLAALFREDLLGLMRQDGRTLWGSLTITPLLAGYFYFPSSNGCCSAETLTTGALILLTFGAAAGAGVVSAVVLRRGDTLDPAARPIAPHLRVAALQGIASLTSLPLILALALLSGGAAGLVLHGWALAAGAVAVGTWRPWRPFNTGSYVAWSLLAGFGAVGSPILSVALGGLASAAAARRLAYLRRNPWARR